MYKIPFVTEFKRIKIMSMKGKRLGEGAGYVCVNTLQVHCCWCSLSLNTAEAVKQKNIQSHVDKTEEGKKKRSKYILQSN
jgi:hypothetical protein